MTQPHEVNVTDAEVHAFYANAYAPEQLQFEAYRQALAAFLAARLPDAMDAGDDDYSKQALKASAHNALRAAVLRGPKG